jgi:PrcB C-terminal
MSMKRSFYLPVRIIIAIVFIFLVWIVAGCASDKTSPAPTDSLIPSAISTLPCAPTSATSAFPASVLGETTISFETLTQGFRLNATQPEPTVLLAFDPPSRDTLVSLVSKEHQALLNQVDLDKKAILAATWGAKPSGGFSITICTISITDTTLTVNVILKDNDPNVPKIDASTLPYHLVLIDRSDLPSQENLHYRLVSDGAILNEGELR